MRERLLGKRNFREIVASFRSRILGSPIAPTETPEEAPDNPQMWEILNVMPIVELNKLTPEERARFEEKAARELQRQMSFQNDLNLTVEEFFAKKSSSIENPQR